MTTRLSQTKFLTVLDPLPLENIGWSVRVLSERDYTSPIGLVERFMGIGFTDEVNGPGGGKVVLDADDPLLTGPLPTGETVPILGQQALWQFYEDGVWRFEMLHEDTKEGVVPEGGGPRSVEVIGRGTGTVLDWAKVLPAGMPTPTSFTRKFTAHPMAVWVQLFEEAQAAGYLPFVSLLFDDTLDSSARPWGAAQPVEVSAGDSLLDLLNRWCEANDLTWRMLRGFRLQVLPLSLGRRLGEKVVFTLYRGQQNHERQATRREIATDVYAASGDKGLAVVSDADAAAKWKKRMLWISAGDTADAGGRSAVANSTLALVKDEKVSRTISVPPDEPGRRVFVDYTLTDWIMVEVPDGSADSGERQVRAIAVDVDQDAKVGLELVLQSRFESRQEKINRVLDRMGAGETTGTGSKITVQQALAATVLEDLSNVDVAGKQTNDLLGWSGTKWVDKTPNLNLLTDVDTVTTPPEPGQALVYDDTSGLWVPGDVAAGGGGGGGVSPWKQPVNLPLTTLTGWGAGAGTWTADAAGIHQTAAGASTSRQRLLTRLGLSEFYVEVEIRLDSAASGGSAGVTLRTPLTDAGGGMRVDLRSNGTQITAVGMESDGLVADGTYTLDAPVAHGTFVTLGLHGRGNVVEVFVNGVLLTNVNVPATANGPYLGLVGYNATATWRNLKVWLPALPSETGLSVGQVTDRRWVPGPGEISIDEFNDGVLDPAWTRVDPTGGASRMTWMEGAEVLSGQCASGDSAAMFHALLRPIGTPMAIGDAFVTHQRSVTQMNQLAVPGMGVTDGVAYGAGSQMFGTAYLGNNYAVNVSARGGTNFNATGPESAAMTIAPSGGLYTRLVKTGATEWRVDVSMDGVQWWKGSPVTHSLTPTHVGFATSSWTSSYPHLVNWEFLRRVAGVT